MMKKIFTITYKAIIGIAIFYLILGFVIIPLVLTWAIQAQGSKILKTPVKVRGVQINPIMLSLAVNGLSINDKSNNQLVGFDRFAIDVSFLHLLQKKYRIESIVLNGFNVNAALLPGGKINLLDLVPPTSTSPATQPAKATAGKKDEPLPLVVIDAVNINNASVNFTDATVNPNFKTSLHGVDITLTGLSTDPASQAHVLLKALLDDKGKMSSETMIKPFVVPLALETTFSMNDYVLRVLTPYVGKYTGRELKDGKFDLKMDYRIADNKLTASHQILIQRFEFGNKVESPDALHLPFGLVVALLEDPQGRIKIKLPVTGKLDDPKFEYFHLIGQVAGNFFTKLITKPFSIIASALGDSDEGTDELAYIKFIPGKATITDEHKKQLAIIAKALKERPKLHVEINGGYDPDVDWKAIKTDIMNKEYNVLRQDSTRTESWVYRELYQRRFGIRALWSLAKKHKISLENYKDDQLIQDIKRQLVEDAPADKVAMEALAQTRAKGIYDTFIVLGFDPAHLSMGASKSTQASMGVVASEFTLTVFGEQDKSETVK